MNKSDFLTRAKTARMLGVSPGYVDRFAQINGIRVWQLPGHNRRWFRRDDVERVIAAAADMGARA